MVPVKLRYYVIKNGRGYFQPSKAMRQHGFDARCLGENGPPAWAEAHRLYEDWLRVQRGEKPASEIGKGYPPGSVGHAFDRYRRTETWKSKAAATRKKDWEWSWQFIEPVFGDIDPKTIEIEHIEALRMHVLLERGLHTAHRLIKVWRALWKIMAAMKYCDKDADPSKPIPNTAPSGRSETWKPGELARLGKHAWRSGYHGLATIISIAWDTQFSPGDCRLLKLSQLVKDPDGWYFKTARVKTDEAVIGTLSRRTERMLADYLESLPAAISDNMRIFRNRSGQFYSADTLGDDFRDIRAKAFPGDHRVLLDIRRTGAVEALAGGVDPGAMAAKMGNSIDQSKVLQKTYLPNQVETVRLADEARRRGRNILRKNKQ